MGEHGMHLLESVWYMQTQLLLPVSLLEMSGGKEFASTARARWGCRVVSLVRRGESSHRTLPSTQQHWSVQKRTSAVPLNPHEGVYDTGGTAAVGLPRQPKSEETSQSEKGLGCDSITYQPSRRLTEIDPQWNLVDACVCTCVQLLLQFLCQNSYIKSLMSRRSK